MPRRANTKIRLTAVSGPNLTYYGINTMDNQIIEAVKGLQEVFSQQVCEVEKSAIVITVMAPNSQDDIEVLHAGSGDTNAMLNIHVASFEKAIEQLVSNKGVEVAHKVAASILAKMAIKTAALIRDQDNTRH